MRSICRNKLGLIALLCVTSTPVVAQTVSDPIQDPVNPGEIERLRQQITRESRSTVDLIGEYRNESGDVNTLLNIWRYGARVNVRIQPGSTFSFGVVRTHYRPSQSGFETSGTSLAVGLRTAASDTVNGQFEFGLTMFSTDTVTVNALANLNRRLTERTTLYFAGSRTNVEESLLSATGLRPVGGPFASELVGAVMDNRFAVGLQYQLAGEADVFGEWGFGNRHGSNVGSNFLDHARAGAGVNLISQPLGEAVTLLRASYQLNYFGFSDNRFGFGGASMQNLRGQLIAPAALGTDGISPVPGVTSAGLGGYFSPEQFVSNIGRIELQGIAGPEFEYQVAAFLGAQRYTGVPTRLASGLTATAEFVFDESRSLPVTYFRDSVGPFVQQGILAALRIGF